MKSHPFSDRKSADSPASEPNGKSNGKLNVLPNHEIFQQIIAEFYNK